MNLPMHKIDQVAEFSLALGAQRSVENAAVHFAVPAVFSMVLAVAFGRSIENVNNALQRWGVPDVLAVAREVLAGTRA